MGILPYHGFCPMHVSTPILLVGGLLSVAVAATTDTVGNVRVQILSPILVRIEQKSTSGNFEDRPTFMVVNRDWEPVQRTRTMDGATTVLTTANFTVRIPEPGNTITNTEVIADGKSVFKYVPTRGFPSGTNRFPSPDTLHAAGAYVIADKPRVIPPAWGSTPMPTNALPATDPLQATGGWDTVAMNTPDVYVFVDSGKTFASYADVRRTFLKLTGPVPMLPLWALGFQSSRWWAYKQSELIAVIDKYRSEKVPLDVLITDVDWHKQNEMYEFAPDKFPDPAAFFQQAHDRHVKVGFNDHPMGSAMDFKLRWDGLTKIMDLGLDWWWYDRNWAYQMQSPIAGLDKEVWGQRQYWDIVRKYRPQMRPYQMSVRSGDRENGPTGRPAFELTPHPASHRYPSWWTGDISCEFKTLKLNQRISVNDGLLLLPWVQSDIAGYQTGDPGDELYTRWMQWGSMCPIFRIHGYHGPEWKRFPWQFTPDIQSIVTRYIEMRYRLMPMLYQANRRAYESGVPVFQRCDLLWPAETYPEASSPDQYIFADDILVKPVTDAGSSMSVAARTSVWVPPGDWFDAWTDALITGPATIPVSALLWQMPMYVRRGSILMSVANHQYTTEKPWDPVVLDVYPPAAGSVSRTLYEDDGVTNQYLADECSKTTVTVTSTTNGVILNISPAQGTYNGQLKNRAWLVRLHGAADQAKHKLTVEGLAILPGSAWDKGAVAQARVLSPQPWPDPVTAANFPIPFRGEGTAPGPASLDPVVEIWLPGGSTSRARTLSYGDAGSGGKETR